MTALVAATLVPVFAFASVLVYQHAASERAGMKARVEETARILALVVDKEIERSQALLEGLAASPLLDRGDFEGFYRQAKHTAPDEERWIILFDRNRDQIINTPRPFGAALPKNVRAPAVDEVLRTGAPAVTDLLRGAVAGRPVVATGVPVLRGGEVRYVVSVTYGAEALSRLLVRHGLPQGWTISIVDRTGTIVARNRGAPKFVGAMAVPELAQAIRQSASGSLEAATLEGEACLALHELATNSVKHGALGSPDGEVTLTCRIEERDGLPWASLSWCESGGPPVAPPSRSGFGRQLLERIVPHSLDGEAQLDFGSDGLRYVVAFPLKDMAELDRAVE